MCDKTHSVPPVEALRLPSLPAKNKLWDSPHSQHRLLTSDHDSLGQKWDDPPVCLLPDSSHPDLSPQVKSTGPHTVLNFVFPVSDF